MTPKLNVTPTDRREVGFVYFAAILTRIATALEYNEHTLKEISSKIK
jgi:hypothetical protein